MTKSEKKKVLLDLLRQYILSENPADNEKLIETIIIEVYSSGYSTVGKLEIVNNAINIFLGDIIKNAFNRDTQNWETAESVISLLTLVDLSQLSD